MQVKVGRGKLEWHVGLVESDRQQERGAALISERFMLVCVCISLQAADYPTKKPTKYFYQMDLDCIASQIQTPLQEIFQVAAHLFSKKRTACSAVCKSGRDCPGCSDTLTGHIKLRCS